MPTEEELEILGRKVTQLKLAYDQYFLGTRPREPVMLRDEVAKALVVYSNQGIKNTAVRFKFGSICSRYQAFKRQWTETLRKIDEGTYVRHQFKAGLRQPQAAAAAPPPQMGDGSGPARSEIYSALLEARRACGQSGQLSAEKLDSILDTQEAALRKRYGGGQVRFRVVVENGRAKLKASRV